MAHLGCAGRCNGRLNLRLLTGHSRTDVSEIEKNSRNNAPAPAILPHAAVGGYAPPEREAFSS
jgi:hypothetical protein